MGTLHPQSPRFEDPCAKCVEFGGTGVPGLPSPYLKAPRSGIWRNPSLGFLSPVPAWPPPRFCSHTPMCNCIPTTNKVPIVQRLGLECLLGRVGGWWGETPASAALRSSELGRLSPGGRREGRKPAVCWPPTEFYHAAVQVSPEQIPLIRL